MAAILSHPFRLDSSGAVVTVEDGSTVANAEAIAVLVGTRLAERGMCPTFGVPDPTFGELSAADVASGLRAWGPDGVTITAVDHEPIDDTTVAVTISFDEGDDQ